ncbi:EAL domain-containing protein [Microvirga sp. BT688]|uniref:putative bifunctional diguanylate cyclase/phosphodiesterase n=1 Tax=Microvirga sp. TaxID=1873136 RepID=UPI00168640BA|nr:EAL domain-containing protein [Microvirga sp.]MBD2750187.1 EAL domain-containing protein [Microvirga sp.]
MSFRILKLLLAVVVSGFLLAAIYFTVVIAERQDALRRISRYNPTWQAQQALSEFMKLDQSLRMFKDENGDGEKEEVQTRFDIFAGTINSLAKGSFRVLIEREPSFERTISKLAGATNDAAPLIESLNNPDDALAALQSLHPLQSSLTQFAAVTFRHGTALTSDDQQELTQLHWIFSSVVGFLILFGLALIGLLARHNILLERTYRRVGNLAADLTHLAHHDPLTGLANRALFQERLEQSLENAPNDGSTLAVLYLDLDLFKNVNDTLGHETGDRLLKTVAARIQACVRDNSVIARLGGDEFAILTGPINIVQECTILASRIVKEIGSVYDIDGHEIIIGTSIGIASTELGTSSPEQLLKQADMALYRAKADGRGTFRFFEPEMDIELQARRALEVDLRKAMVNNELYLAFQPQVSLQANDVTGFEALLRWRHPVRGSVSPVEFIPIAEDIGLIASLSEWVINEACRTAVTWPENMKVAVNISPVQFRNRTLLPCVRKALMRTGLDPSRLELELTESALLEENETTVTALHELRNLGVRIALDDFGTGYSSLSYLRSFPFDKIKIDQSFVRELFIRPDCMVIIRSIVGLGRGLGMSITAEGVETDEQLAQIRAAGCTEAQGYLLGRPKPASDLGFSGTLPALV